MPPKKSEKILVIVESPGKIKKIQDILGDKYIVSASVGHIIDLSAKKMSIDIENDFKPKYEYLYGKEKIIQDLKKLSSMSSDILLATDEDREGEMIAWSLAHVLDIKNPKRITFNSITSDEILNAVKNYRKIDYDLVDAQKARRILDRIVGYEISPVLWKSMGQGSLSAGRVQSVVVKLIIDRENEIDEFFKSKLVSYFNMTGKFLDKKKTPFVSTLYSTKKSKIVETDEEDDKEKVEVTETETKKNGDLHSGSKCLIEDGKQVKTIMKSLQKSKFKIQGIGSRESIKNPSAPFTTSTLQQEASRKLGFAIKRTMSVAQNLYEAGHITYMRTDSVNLSKEAMKAVTKYVLESFGKAYSKPKEYKGKTTNAQEAHEAVRPTHFEHKTLTEKGKIGSDEIKLYQLIWKRTVASQMSSAIFNVNTTQIGISELKDYFFSTEVSTVKFNGFLAVYDIKNIENEIPEKNDDTLSIVLPKVGEEIKYSEFISVQNYQKPPPRYNEAMLVKKLDPDNLNIGRPSTYAAITTKIQEREYVRKMDHEGKEVESITFHLNNKDIKEEKNKVVLGKDTNRLSPTHMGKVVTNFLNEYFSDIMDYSFTATMEDNLDKIAEGQIDITKVLKEFYKDFHKTVQSLDKKQIKILDENKRILGKDPETGFNVVATHKKYGPIVMIETGKTKENMAPIKPPLTLDTINLKQALELLSYPKLLGRYEKKEVKLHRGKFGLYVKIGDENISLNSLKLKNEGDLEFEQVIELIKERMKKYLWSGKEGKVEYLIMEGPYGRFINVTDKSKKLNKPLNVKLVESTKIEELTLDKVKLLVEEGKLNKFKKKKKEPANTKLEMKKEEKLETNKEKTKVTKTKKK